MGLNFTHGCFSGSYSAFFSFRVALADAAGLPPLELMAGFFPEADPVPAEEITELVSEAQRRGHDASTLPIAWDALPTDPLHVLLRARDLGGRIPHGLCRPLATRLRELLITMRDSAEREEGAADQSMSELPVFSQQLALQLTVAEFAAGLERAHEAGHDVHFG